MVRPRRKKGKKVTTTGTGQFSLRPRLARLIPHNALFEPEITDEGILYRFVGLKGQAKKVQEPEPDAEWLRTDGAKAPAGDKLVAVTDDELEAVQRMRQSQAAYNKGAQG
jgi:hypothetical protein